MVKSDLRVCVDCGCVFNREIGLEAISNCPVRCSENREPLEFSFPEIQMQLLIFNCEIYSK